MERRDLILGPCGNLILRLAAVVSLVSIGWLILFRIAASATQLKLTDYFTGAQAGKFVRQFRTSG